MKRIFKVARVDKNDAHQLFTCRLCRWKDHFRMFYLMQQKQLQHLLVSNSSQSCFIDTFTFITNRAVELAW